MTKGVHGFLHLVLVATTLAQTPTAPSKKDEPVWQTIRTYVEATRTYNADVLTDLFHNDYLEVSPIGEVDLREKTLSFYWFPEAKHPKSPDSITVVPVSLRYPSKDVAVAVYTQSIAMGTMKMEIRTSTTLKQTRGKWLLYSNHFTPVRPARAKG